jgi:formylmethanofuran dehydrogenase subunit E
MYGDQGTPPTEKAVGAYSFAEFKEMVRHFHSYPAPGVLIGGYMVELARFGLPRGTLFEAVVETGKCLPDAVQLLTPCSTGNGWIRIVNLGRYALSLYDKYTGRGRRVRIDLDELEKWPEIADWLLKRKNKDQQDTEALFSQIQQAGSAYMVAEPVQIEPRLLGKKSSGRIARCPVCGEAYPAEHGGLCRGCQGEAPYVSEGDGGDVEEAAPTAVPVEDAVGLHALHDMTRIEPGRSKGPAFSAGQRISTSDVCRLQQMGRTSVFVREWARNSPEWTHENDAVHEFARRMAGPGVTYGTPPSEGKINFRAERDGLFCLDSDKLEQFNLVPQVMCATRHNRVPVERDKVLAGSRALPLYLPRKEMDKTLAVLGEEPLFRVREMRSLPAGVLVSGTEVFRGLVRDRFTPIVREKLARFGCPIVHSEVVPDEEPAIEESVRDMLSRGAELIITTAGLSVDPDDRTRQGLLQAGLTDMLYGAPVLPGAMTLVGRIGRTRILGVPACALFHRTTSLDLLLPLLLAGEEITRKDLAGMAEGGLCLGCKACTFPKCPFGK